MNADNYTPAVMDPPTSTDDAGISQDSLRFEASRLMEFKKEKIKRGNQTPCPACATYVHINANKCPHCSSDIAANNALVRESLRRLDEITAQIEVIHGQHMERFHGAPRRPIAERIKSFFYDPQTKKDMKVVIPVGMLFFATVGTLRALGLGTFFWIVAAGGGVIAYTVLVKLNVKRLVTIDLYRAVLVYGLLLLMVSAFAQPMSAPSRVRRGHVKVAASTANVRESNSTESAVVATVREGDQLFIIERTAGWYKVRVSDGREGWVHAALVRE